MRIPTRTHTHTAGLTELVLDEREKEKFQDLHRSIKACDEVLESVESYLSAFQTDLGTVSGEIESLQSRSMSLGKQLENRKAVEKLLGPVVDDVVIPPHDVRRFVEGDVNDSWVKALYETDRRMTAIKAKDPAKVKAVQEVLPELEKITHKVPLLPLSRVLLLTRPDNRESAGLLRFQDQGAADPGSQRATYPAAGLSAVQAAVSIHGEPPHAACRGNRAGLHQHDAVVLLHLFPEIPQGL